MAARRLYYFLSFYIIIVYCRRRVLTPPEVPIYVILLCRCTQHDILYDI